MSAAIGSLLSIALQGCALRDRPRPAAPAAIAVDPRVGAPADLLACPAAPAGFPETASATIPVDVRLAAIRLAIDRATLATQLARLIAWETGVPCP